MVIVRLLVFVPVHQCTPGIFVKRQCAHLLAKITATVRRLETALVHQHILATSVKRLYVHLRVKIMAIAQHQASALVHLNRQNIYLLACDFSVSLLFLGMARGVKFRSVVLHVKIQETVVLQECVHVSMVGQAAFVKLVSLHIQTFVIVETIDLFYSDYDFVDI